MLLLLITRCNHYFGLSDMFMFLFTGSFAESIERIMTILPSFIIMAKIIKPGVEGTMLALTGTIINLNQFLIRANVGAFINDLYVGVTAEKLDDYYILGQIFLYGHSSNQEVDNIQKRYMDQK